MPYDCVSKRTTVGLALGIVAMSGLPLAQASEAKNTHAPVLIGIVRETETRVSPQISGRLAAVHVVKGQSVHKGDLLAELEAPELTAAVGEATAATGQSRSKRDNVFAGPRPEIVARAAQDVDVATSNLTFARQQFVRYGTLAAKGIASQQVFDEVSAGQRKAEARLASMKAVLAQLQAGPTPEERAQATTGVALAEAAMAVARGRLEKTQLVAPTDGVVSVVVGNPGEIVAAGKPVLTIAEDHGTWLSFTVREDELGDIAIGRTLEVASDVGPIRGRVSELRPLGEFATWRAARAVGDHDLNSFRLRIDPEPGARALAPGMTVRLTR